jgi:hypothetical protein
MSSAHSPNWQEKRTAQNYTMNSFIMSLTCAIIVAFSLTTTVLHVTDKLP